MATPSNARARVRAEITAEILEAAREELSRGGAADLSLRAVARRLGMAPSALYRYFDSRDALLTVLIVEAYDAVGEAAETAAGAAGSPLDRWLAVARAVRSWAADHPQAWALVYGSPVPGYRAPQLTVGSALRTSRVVAQLVTEGLAAGGAPASLPAPPGMGEVVAPVREVLLAGQPPEVVIGVLLAWTTLIGTVSLELFGHYVGAFSDIDAAYDYAMEITGRQAGLV